MNNYKKYLMVVEKTYIKTLLDNAFANVREQLTYAVDIVVANNHVIDLNQEVHMYCLDDINANAKPFYLNGQKISERYLLMQSDFYKNNGSQILKLVQENTYDAIVNACDPDDAGDLIFQYVIETLNLQSYQTIRIHYSDLTEDSLVNIFISLK